jgi:hypothetical protein
MRTGFVRMFLLEFEKDAAAFAAAQMIGAEI